MFLALEFLAMPLKHSKENYFQLIAITVNLVFSVLILHVAIVIFLLGCTAFTQSNAT